MSIKAYIGRMGSGKTYEVVTSVILPALSRGRRVISNIAGLDYDEFCAVLVEDGFQIEQIGQLVQVSHDDVLRPEFWMTDKDSASERAAGLVDKNSGELVQCIVPGDLVALDENWRFWEGYATKAMPDRVMNFFRMHRHFTHSETGTACDVALISQDVMDFSRKVRAVIEETYYMEKLTAVGSSKRYRIDLHQGGKISRKPLRQLQRSYDPRFFPLYSSHSLKQDGAADAKEENIDGRGNILHGALFKVGLPIAGLVMLVSFYGVYKFFNPAVPVNVPATNSSTTAAPIPPSVPLVIPSRPVQVIADHWRLLGWYQSPQGLIAIITNDSGMLRKVSNPPAYKLSDSGLEFELPEGGFVTPWTGQFQKNGGLL